MTTPPTPPLTVHTAVVLQRMLTTPTEWYYNGQLTELLGIGPGVGHTRLRRLHRRGLVERRWETGTARELGRPLRCYYRITPGRIAEAEAAVRSATAQLTGAPVPAGQR